MSFRSTTTALLTTACALGVASTAGAAPALDSQALQDAVKVGSDSTGIKRHLKKLQGIATANGGNRATGTTGHSQSADYVKQTLQATGYFDVADQPFTATIYTQVAPATLSATPAASPAWVEGQDYQAMEFSGNGSFTNSPFVVVDYTPPTNQASASTSGCEQSDFPATVKGKVAVIQRGTCDFSVKAANAQAAGAIGVILFNEGTLGDGDRNGIINGTVGSEGAFTIPVIEGTYAVGKYLVDHPSATVSGANQGRVDKKATRNVVAKTKTGRTDRQVVVGAHLDSVEEGPGINDDGSGSATDLEIALQMAKLRAQTRNQVVFVWFSGEEQGLFGSQHYVDQLTTAQRKDTAAMLDFDMLASPNYALQVYDGDGSDFDASGPNGSGTVESVLRDWFTKQDIYTETMEFDGRSDYDGFTAAGIPAGGLATGAEVHKTPAEQAQWGGVVSPSLAGQFDPCYHLACDSYPSNINGKALNLMSDAVANGVWTFAQTTSAVNGTDNGSSSSTKDFEWKGDHRVK